MFLMNKKILFIYAVTLAQGVRHTGSISFIKKQTNTSLLSMHKSRFLTVIHDINNV